MKLNEDYAVAAFESGIFNQLSHPSARAWQERSQGEEHPCQADENLNENRFFGKFRALR